MAISTPAQKPRGVANITFSIAILSKASLEESAKGVNRQRAAVNLVAF
jgi:hypothetical protein